MSKDFEIDTMPLFADTEEKPVLTDNDTKKIKEQQVCGRPKKADSDSYQRMTFIVKKDLLKKLRDYAYTERVDLKIAINRAMEQFLADKDNLLTKPDEE